MGISFFVYLFLWQRKRGPISLIKFPAWKSFLIQFLCFPWQKKKCPKLLENINTVNFLIDYLCCPWQRRRGLIYLKRLLVRQISWSSFFVVLDKGWYAQYTLISLLPDCVSCLSTVLCCPWQRRRGPIPLNKFPDWVWVACCAASAARISISANMIIVQTTPISNSESWTAGQLFTWVPHFLEMKHF